MSDKKLVQYKAYIDKESGSVVCNTLTSNENVTINCTSSTYGLLIVGNSNSQAGTQITYMDGTYTAWNIGPNFTGGRGGGVGIYDFLFNNPYLGYNQIVIQHDNAIVNINSTLNVNQSVNVTNTLTANTLVATNTTITTLTANNIVATGIQLNVTGNNPQGISIIGVTGSTPSDDATQIFFQSNSSGTITTHWQLGPNFSTANPPDFWLYNNIGGYNTLQIHANTPLIDIVSSINVTGSVTLSGNLTANTINATTITNPSGTSGTINVTGNVSVSSGNTLTATTINVSTLTATTINPTPSSYSYAGSSGFAYVVQPFTGSGYKKVLLLFSSYVPGATDETYDFPVNFAEQYQVTSNINNLSYTLTSGSIEITNFSTSTTYNNGITIEGW